MSLLWLGRQLGAVPGAALQEIITTKRLAPELLRVQTSVPPPSGPRPSS